MGCHPTARLHSCHCLANKGGDHDEACLATRTAVCLTSTCAFLHGFGDGQRASAALKYLRGPAWSHTLCCCHLWRTTAKQHISRLYIVPGMPLCSIAVCKQGCWDTFWLLEAVPCEEEETRWGHSICCHRQQDRPLPQAPFSKLHGDSCVKPHDQTRLAFCVCAFMQIGLDAACREGSPSL